MDSSAPKPGSRRARRLAEQAAKAAAPAAVVKANRVVLPANRDVYAEYMNERHVLSQVSVYSAPARPRLFSRSRAAVLALVVMTSGLSVAAGAATFEDPNLTAAVEAGTATIGATETEAVTEVVTVEPLQAKITVDGKTVEAEVLTGSSVAKLLDEAGVTLSALDEVSVPLDAQVTEGLAVTVVRVTTEVVTEEEIDKFEVIEEDDATLAKGEKKVETEGVDGKINKTFEVTYRDGEESTREVIAEVVVQKRVDEVVKVGTKEDTGTTATDADATSAPASTGPVSSGSNRDIARSMLASFGWGDDQWPYLDQLWQRESGWNQYADNPYSSAYGIPQALPGSKMASAGADWATNPATQIKWGLGYIKSRYGSPAAAWAHSQSVGWY